MGHLMESFPGSNLYLHANFGWNIGNFHQFSQQDWSNLRQDLRKHSDQKFFEDKTVITNK